jgi:hypothetical protein
VRPGIRFSLAVYVLWLRKPVALLRWVSKKVSTQTILKTTPLFQKSYLGRTRMMFAMLAKAVTVYYLSMIYTQLVTSVRDHSRVVV